MSKFFKKALPIVGSIAGAATGIPGGAAIGGALGGALAGGGSSGSNPSVTTKSKTGPVFPAYIPPQLQNIVTRARALMDKPYEAYTGQRVAGLAPDELAAIQSIRDLQGRSTAGLEEATGLTRDIIARSLAGPTPASIAAFMNPYQQQVMDLSRARQFEAFDRAKNQLLQQQAATGAFGGSRSGLALAQLSRDFQNQLAEQEARQLYQGYGDALGRSIAGTQYAGSQAGNLANFALQGQNSALQAIAALQGAGGLQRGLTQQGLDVAYQDFLTKQEYPYKQLGFGASLINPIAGIVSGQGATNTQITREGSPGLAGQILGGVAAAQGLGIDVGKIGQSIYDFGKQVFSPTGIANPITYSRTSSDLDSLFSSNAGLFGLGRKEGGLVHSFEHGGPIPGLAQGGYVEEYVDGGLVSNGLDYLSNLVRGSLQDYRGIRSEPFVPRMPGETGIERFGRYGDNINNLLRKVMASPMAPIEWGYRGTGAVADFFRNPSAFSPEEAITPGIEATANTPAKLEALRQAQNQLVQQAMAKSQTKPSAVTPAQQKAQAVVDALTKKTGTQQKETTKVTTSPVTKAEEGPKINMPLLQFGASLLSSNRRLGPAIGDALKVYGKGIQDREAGVQAAAQQALDNELARRKVAAYEQQVRQSGPTPWAEELARARIKALSTRASNNDQLATTAARLLIAGKQTDINYTPEQALDEASKIHGQGVPQNEDADLFSGLSNEELYAARQGLE